MDSNSFLLILYQVFNTMLYPLRVASDLLSQLGALQIVVGLFGLGIVCSLLIPRIKRGD